MPFTRKNTRFLKLKKALILVSIFVTVRTFPIILIFLVNFVCGEYKAQILADDSLSILLEGKENDTIKVRTLMSKGWEWRATNSDKAIEWTKKSIDLALKCKYNFGLACAYNNLGGIYYYKGMYEQAVENYLRALPIHITMKDSLRLGKVYNNLGLVYNDLLNHKTALDYFEKAFDIKRAQRNKNGMAATLNNIGRVYAYQKDYDRAKEKFLQSLELEKETKNEQGEAECYQCLGNVASLEKKPVEAAKFYELAFGIYEKLNDVENMAGCLSGISEAYTETGNYKEGIKFGLRATDFANKYNLDKESSYKALALAYEGDGNVKEALKYTRLANAVHDSIYSVELANKVTELEVKYRSLETESKNKLLAKENDLLTEKAEKRKLYMLLIGGVSVFIVVMLLLVSSYRKKQQKIELARNKAEFELQALMAQMNPHFIFNALNSIQHFILEKGKQEAYDYLAKFSKLVRMVLNNSEDKLVSLQKELELIGLYVELEQLRFTDGFDYKLTITGNVNAESIELPSLLLQPYIENAIWHGIMNLDKGKKGVLQMDISVDFGKLKIIIEDNGVGRAKALEFRKDEMHRSVGMKLTERRLQMISKMSGFESTRVNVIDLENNGGTRVEILLPLK